MRSFRQVILKTSTAITITICLLVVLFFGGPWLMYTIKYWNDPDIYQAKKDQMLNDLWFDTWYKRTFWIMMPIAVIIVFVYYGFASAKSKLKKASVHTYEIGDSKLVVHEKDLSLAAPLSMGLVSAKQLEHLNRGIEKGAEKAGEIYAKIGNTAAKQAQSLVDKHVTQIERVMLPADRIPTFQELLAAEEIVSGKPMILGYENGVPRRGSFLDIYSAAVAGETGTGKTATLLFLIGSGIVADNVYFIGIDPHYPHPKSLSFKTKPLWESGLMDMATYYDDMLNVLAQVEHIIDNRLKQIDTDTTPVVLVIDEPAFLLTLSVADHLIHTMERVSMEGRKCAVYMLASSQTWLAARFKNSVTRDTLTSAYVHRIKPKQANLLLQDKEEAEKVKKYVKQAGDVLFCPVNDESAVCKIPYTTEADMKRIAEMLRDTCIPSQNNASRGLGFDKIGERYEDVSHELKSEISASDSLKSIPTLQERTKILLDLKEISYGIINDEIGIAKSTMHNFLNENGNLNDEQRGKLQAFIERIEEDAKTPIEQA